MEIAFLLVVGLLGILFISKKFSNNIQVSINVYKYIKRLRYLFKTFSNIYIFILVFWYLGNEKFFENIFNFNIRTDLINLLFYTSIIGGIILILLIPLMMIQIIGEIEGQINEKSDKKIFINIKDSIFFGGFFIGLIGFLAFAILNKI
ncbi:MAG: hypothetical protein PHI37_03940 [Candidatus Gracilibacteria bacterium]|nr:hypothetical protein [Candidatus Gracilibacteria bacterium]